MYARATVCVLLPRKPRRLSAKYYRLRWRTGLFLFALCLRPRQHVAFRNSPLPFCRISDTYLPTDDDGFLHCYGNFEKNSTDIEVVFSYLRHMERTQRFQIEGRNISDCNRSLNLMKFYYHSRLYLRTSINFIVPDWSPPLECNYRVTMINRWNPKANTATDNSVHFPGSSTTVQPAEPCRAVLINCTSQSVTHHGIGVGTYILP